MKMPSIRFYVLAVIFGALAVYGILTGEFLETWRNGATL